MKYNWFKEPIENHQGTRTEQLLVQMKDAISIFEEAHPDWQALFVFDQSSVHASLGPDALSAWDMTKSDGGSSINGMTWSFLNQIHSQHFAVTLRKWHSQMVNQRVYSVFLRSEDSMFRTCVLNVLPFAHTRIITVAWLAFSANKKTLRTSPLCSRQW